MNEDTWQAVRHRCEALDPDAVLVTPGEERPFVVERVLADRIVVSPFDGGERSLRRDQFAVLADAASSEPLSLDSLPPGVGPYVAVLSLAPGFEVDESVTELRAVAEGEADPAAAAEDDRAATDEVSWAVESPLVRSRWDVRRPPETVHDDALLVADFLERHDALDPTALSESDLVDGYVLLSDLQRGADALRRDVGTDLLDRLGPEGRLRGQFGSVSRVHRERRGPKDDEEVLARLDEAGVPREWVLGVDEDKLDVVVATTDVDAEDVYDASDSYHVRKTDVESDAKRARLRGLRDRLDDLDGEDADEVRDEIERLEARLDDMLAAD